MRQGEVLLEVWGGASTPGQAWQSDTLACCFSVSKGVLSLLAHIMVSQCEIVLDTPVGEVWPGFTAENKGAITLFDILTHRAGLPAVSRPVAAGDLYDWDLMVGHLEKSAVVVPPRASPAYHNMTYGHLLGETLRRAAGAKSLRGLLKERVIDPLGVDFRIGLTNADAARSAQLTQADPEGLFRALAEAPEGLFARSMAFFDRDKDFNSARWRGAVIGSGSGHATARALATLYGQYIWDDAILPTDRQTEIGVEQAQSHKDPILGIPMRFGQGVELSTPPHLDFGPNPNAIGHWGAGGAQAFADPRLGISFGYVTGHMSDQMGSSARATRLVQLLYGCLSEN
jgi:CubicO group peptidase (beta-lactamase class C family)